MLTEESDMNKQLQEFARSELKKGLSLCTDNEKNIFSRMYSHKDPKKDINLIVDDMPEDRLDWAMVQVKRTLDKK